MKRSLVVASSWILWPLAATMMWGCADRRGDEASRTGWLRTALRGTSTTGVEYRLRNGVFTISGASAASVSTEDDPDAGSLSVELTTGAYLVRLEPGWRLERATVADIFEPVTAVLSSPNPVAFTITEQATTSVRFRFRADDDEVELHRGTLDLGIDVDDAPKRVDLEPGVAMRVGQQPTNGYSFVATGDLDEDGWPDIALAHGFSTGGTVLNQHNSTFSAEALVSEPWWDAPAHLGATSVALADLDLDGDLDYVFAVYGDHYVEKMIQLYAGDGKGNHSIPPQVPNGLVYELSGANPMGTRVADFDHNGLPDLVSGSNNGAHTVDIILQTSPWVFTPTFAYNQMGSANPQWIDIGDFNNDGWMDLVVPFLYGQVEVYLNTANGTGAMIYAGGYLPEGHHVVAVADLDGDGFQDIAARGESEDRVEVLYGDGSGHFPRAAAFGVSGHPGSIAAGDIDGDGKVDLVVSSFSNSTVDVLLNDGLGAFLEAVPIALDESPTTLALDDFDQDGDVDVVVYTTTYNVSDHLRVLWNRRVRSLQPG